MFIKKAYTYSTFLCLFFSFLPYSMLASSPISNNSQDKPHTEQSADNKDEGLINEDKFIQCMDEASKELQQLDSNNPVLFLGPTGAGKSTMICSLLFGKLEKIKKDIFFEGQLVDTVYNIGINDTKGRKHPKIGHKHAVSCTLFPACYPLKAHKLDLCDFAGIFDSGGIEKRTAISITSKLFLERSDDIKAIVFVMSQSDLESSRAHIMNQVMQGLQKMFGNPLAYVDSIFFALTKSSYSAPKFRYTINQLKDSIKGNKDKSETSNSKTLHDLLDTMLTKHKEHFLLVNPLEEESSKLIIARLKQSKGFPSKAIRFIGDEDINRASLHFFTRCAREGKVVLNVCNTYPNKIEEKTKYIPGLSLEISQLSQEIDDFKNGKGHQKIFADLVKRFKSDIVKAKEDLAALKEEKAAKEKYISDYDNQKLVEVFCQSYPKSDMYCRLKFLYSDDGYAFSRWICTQNINLNLIYSDLSYCDVKLEFNSKKGKIVRECMYEEKAKRRIDELKKSKNIIDAEFWHKKEKKIKQIKQSISKYIYKAEYQCHRDGGSDLRIILYEQSCKSNSSAIQQAKKSVQELTETKIPDKNMAIAVQKGKLAVMGELLAMSKIPPNLVKELEARKERQEKELSLLQNKLEEMKKELTHQEKVLLRKQKLFDTIQATYGFLGFTYRDIADFVKEYRHSKKREQAAISTGTLLTAGYIRKSIKALPQRKNIQYRASETIYHLVFEYYLGFKVRPSQQTNSGGSSCLT